MFVVFNELHVPVEGRENVAKRFENSADKMKNIPGCLDFMFLHPEEDTDYQIVLTKWDCKESYEAWVNSDEFKEAHKKRRANLDKSPTTGNKISTYEVKHHL
ncbi:antibiotic biosynthesis monooxygenase family protein [Evansella cellulosilytica]|uniref:Antibiotic biosynthesis monooxygenase n=1 Tax=Evansella cellulosilytica (strain ATCC 21833 / DSM 2522 / FERM P-1141 / JCM 9156 / N-4) TaxID=649639 RepID=E6TTI9_EVAC2|nr:antibiotic biosynthesis monooxygenase [Evansella cellulosilytica]ADU29625.1 Antibiotic biosynthesis monooxygenase [Evansella cellulosilytica DSM 2522]